MKANTGVNGRVDPVRRRSFLEAVPQSLRIDPQLHAEVHGLRRRESDCAAEVVIAQLCSEAESWASHWNDRFTHLRKDVAKNRKFRVILGQPDHECDCAFGGSSCTA